MVTCLACRRPNLRLTHASRHTAFGHEARFCWECRPAVKRVRMRLVRDGEAVTWSPDQVARVRGELTAHGWKPAPKHVSRRPRRKRGT